MEDSQHSDSAIKVDYSTAAPLNIMDLELMHHFCTSTCLKIHNDSTITRIWSISVPVLGFSHDFVMHGILAVAALHLAYLRPEMRDIYLPQATYHHEEGLRKATPALSQLEEGNGSAIYSFSGLTILYTFASSRDDAGIADWIILSRQTYSIIRYSNEKLFNGPLGPMFAAGARRSDLQGQLVTEGVEVPQAEQLIQLLFRICERTADDWKREAYRQAIDELHKVFRVTYSQPLDTLQATDVYIWAYRIKDEYLSLLEEQTQEALVIMVFFAVIPQLFDTEKHWFLDGFGMHLISKIYPLIDEYHLPWIEWPLREVSFAMASR
jgi:Fungal specific transcription factor domain